jgi:hypothetical protein
VDVWLVALTLPVDCTFLLHSAPPNRFSIALNRFSFATESTVLCGTDITVSLVTADSDQIKSVLHYTAGAHECLLTACVQQGTWPASCTGKFIDYFTGTWSAAKATEGIGLERL